MATNSKQWPLGVYLRKARGKMSIRGAAKRAGISEARWRQLEAGYQRMAGGIEVPVHPRPETLVAMCRAVSADPVEALRLAGHNPDQYGWLLEESAPSSMPTGVQLDWYSKLSREEREAVLVELQRMNVDIEIRRREAITRLAYAQFMFAHRNANVAHAARAARWGYRVAAAAAMAAAIALFFGVMFFSPETMFVIAFACLSMVSTAALSLAVLSGNQARIHQAFVAGVRTGQAMQRGEAPRLRAVTDE